jgi:sugar O-acyltransferase (sialic acid O-acetyltransferase NeuD family)
VNILDSTGTGTPMKKIAIIGAGGFGREVIEIFKEQNKLKKQWEILGFIDENKELWGSVINNFKVLGGLDWITQNKNAGCVIAIGDTKTRKKIAEYLEEKNIVFYNAIHPSAIISEFVHLGHGVIICAGSIISVNATIKNHVIINLNSTIGHDAVLENFCSIMPNVSVSGENIIGEGTYLGTGAILIQKITVGRSTMIGAGAIVMNNIPDNVTAFGSPAKIMKK